MSLQVQYLRDAEAPDSECWNFPAFTQDFDYAQSLARDGLQDAHNSFGATCFRILDRDGAVMTDASPTLQPA